MKKHINEMQGQRPGVCEQAHLVPVPPLYDQYWLTDMQELEFSTRLDQGVLLLDREIQVFERRTPTHTARC